MKWRSNIQKRLSPGFPSLHGAFLLPDCVVQPQCLVHHCRGALLALHIKVRVDVRGCGKIAVAEPLLNLLEGYAMGQQERGA